LVEDITNQQEYEGAECDTKTMTEGQPTVGKKREEKDVVEITLPYLPDVVVTVEDMLEKLSKLRYSDHDVCNIKKFPYLEEESYLENKG
jgi:hypothetical protein